MDAYSRYPVVHMTKSTKLTELKKCLTSTIRTYGRPDEIWSNGGAPYNMHTWKRWLKEQEITRKRTNPYHSPASGMVERFNRNLKLVIHAAYAEVKDPEEEVEK